MILTTTDAFEPSIEEKNNCYTSRDTTKWFCNIIMQGHMFQNGWKHTWKRLNGKFYHNHHIHQTLPSLIIHCSNQWHMAWLCSTFISMKMPKIYIRYVQKVTRLMLYLPSQRKTMSETFISFKIHSLALNTLIPTSFSLVEESLKLNKYIHFTVIYFLKSYW